MKSNYLLPVALFAAILLIPAAHAMAQPAPAPKAGAAAVETNRTAPAPATAAATASVPAPYPEGQPAPYPSGSPEAIQAERQRIWNSPEMVEARLWIGDRGRRSTRFSTKDANQYLSRLRALSPSQMQEWLEQFRAQRAAQTRSIAIERAARQASVGQAVERITARQQAFSNISAGQNAAANTTRVSLAGTQQYAQDRVDSRNIDRSSAIATMLFSDEYRWLNENPYAFRAAAAMVPGDLPAGDPANFIRGDTAPVGDAAIDANSK